MKLNMNRQKIVLLVSVVLLFVSCSFAQTKTLVLPRPTPTATVPAPGNIKLIPGYIHTRMQGIDTAVGKISKENGINISYDIGRLAGNYAMGAYSRDKQNVLWFKVQEVNGQKVMITYLKDGSIYATFNDFANFISGAKTNEELADFLIMIMTYGSEDEQKDDIKTKQKKP